MTREEAKEMARALRFSAIGAQAKQSSGFSDPTAEQVWGVGPWNSGAIYTSTDDMPASWQTALLEAKESGLR